MTVVTNMHKTCHDYEGVMLVLCTPLQVKRHPFFLCYVLILPFGHCIEGCFLEAVCI